MIKLKNGYGIVSDGKSFTLVQDAIQVSKDGVKTEIKKQISFHSTLSSALQSYSNCVMADLVSNFDMDLMTAREMFEKLGYKRNVENEKIIYFLELEGTFYYDEITFDLLEKEILIDTNFEVKDRNEGKND